MNSAFHTWRPIEDLPEHWPQLASEAFASLLERWGSSKEALSGSEALRRFNSELVRELAIETGVIEGLYTIDRGTTENLIKDGLVKARLERGQLSHDADDIHALLRDHESATQGVFDFVRGERPLSTSYVKELHAHLTRNQKSYPGRDTAGKVTLLPMIHGDWKQRPNSVYRPDGRLHEYCPPEHVAAEMDRLLEMAANHYERGVPADIAAAWLHHRFTQIHPFADGNGRVARLLATLVFVRAGAFPLSVSRDERTGYIDALEAADGGDLAPLVDAFAATQEKHLRRALDLFEEVALEGLSIEEIASGVAKRLGPPTKRPPFFSNDHVFQFSRTIELSAEEFFNNIVQILRDHAPTREFAKTQFNEKSLRKKTMMRGRFCIKLISIQSEFGETFFGISLTYPHNSRASELRAVPFLAQLKNGEMQVEGFPERALQISAAEDFPTALKRIPPWVEAKLKWLLAKLGDRLHPHA